MNSVVTIHEKKKKKQFKDEHKQFLLKLKRICTAMNLVFIDRIAAVVMRKAFGEKSLFLFSLLITQQRDNN